VRRELDLPSNQQEPSKQQIFLWLGPGRIETSGNGMLIKSLPQRVATLKRFHLITEAQTDEERLLLPSTVTDTGRLLFSSFSSFTV
jgi:hypothetical protein